MAAAVLAGKTADWKAPSIKVHSSGTGSWHIGQGPHPSSKKIWEAAGYEHSHIAQQFTANDFFIHDLILVMDSSNYHNVVSLAENEEHRSKVFYLRKKFQIPITKAMKHMKQRYLWLNVLWMDYFFNYLGRCCKAQ